MDLSDSTTFARAYDTHSGTVYRAAYRVLGNGTAAQDVVQDVFLRLWRRPQAFDARRGQLGPFLRLMGHTRALDVWRESQARGRAGDRLRLVAASEAGERDESIAAAADHTRERGRLLDALGALPVPQREAIVLAYWGGLTAPEIAHRGAVPLGTVKSRIRLGLARLRELIGNDPAVAGLIEPDAPRRSAA
jgi:RNA polymerase sigma-70 factor (ECF subfamily)